MTDRVSLGIKICNLNIACGPIVMLSINVSCVKEEVHRSYKILILNIKDSHCTSHYMFIKCVIPQRLYIIFLSNYIDLTLSKSELTALLPG